MSTTDDEDDGGADRSVSPRHSVTVVAAPDDLLGDAWPTDALTTATEVSLLWNDLAEFPAALNDVLPALRSLTLQGNPWTELPDHALGTTDSYDQVAKCACSFWVLLV